MKKSILKIVAIFTILAFIATSCEKDNNTPDTLNGKYNVSMNGQTIASGNTEEVGILGNAITLSLGESFSIIISGVPLTVGGVAQIAEENSDASVTISGKNLLNDGLYEMYFSINGTITRTSSTKITFTGNCTEMGGSTTYSFNGTAESEAYKAIK